MNILGKDDPYLKIGEVNDRASKGESEYVWALRDINFMVEQGDVLGIIGKNGAGKSTLLKILSKVTAPTTGTIRAKGRIASLLEVGTGFHPEMTGRENIYMNGAIMGMTKAEITRKLDEIVDFAGVERYIDTPVKRYSSGMTVRLGFAIAAHLEPEILVVDEVLAVGDAEFQKKAIGKMQDVSKGEGRTVLFVSHNMGAVRNLCNRGLVLVDGTVIFMGSVDNSIDQYLSLNKLMAETRSSEDLIYQNRKRGYSNDILFVTIEVDGNKSNFYSDEKIVFNCKVKATKATKNFRINGTLYTVEEQALGGWFADDLFSIEKDEEKIIQVSLEATNLAMGAYLVSFSIGVGNFEVGMLDFDVIHHVIKFEIIGYNSLEQSGFSTWDRSWGNFIIKSSCKLIN